MLGVEVDEYAAMRAHRRALAALAAAVALATGMTACGGGDDGGDDPEVGAGQDVTSTTESVTTTTEPPTPAELAGAAYQASWDATFRALNPPAQLPEIQELFTGEALSETVNLIARRERLGHRVEGTVATHPVVVSATSTEVLFDECAIENSVEYDAAGALVDTAENAAYNYRVTVVNEDGSWKVSDFERRDEPCTPG